MKRSEYGRLSLLNDHLDYTLGSEHLNHLPDLVDIPHSVKSLVDLLGGQLSVLSDSGEQSFRIGGVVVFPYGGKCLVHGLLNLGQSGIRSLDISGMHDEVVISSDGEEHSDFECVDVLPVVESLEPIVLRCGSVNLLIYLSVAVL